MCDHHHDHANGCCDHGGDESTAFSLYQKIDTVNLECLNELVDGSGARVFKPWSERMSNDVFVQSDCDAELLFNIPFTGDVKIKGIIVRADEDLHRMRLFKSSLRMSFADVSAEPDQEFEVAYDPTGTYEYPVKPTKFFNVHHLTIHFVNKNKDDDSKPCKIYYIGLKGEFTQANRDGIVIANYEIRPTEDIQSGIDTHTSEVQ
jgi:hypothetical protein